MKTFIRMMCVAAFIGSVFTARSYAWYNQYWANYGQGAESDYVSVPSTGYVSIYGTGEFDDSAWALLRVTTPTQTVDCYTWNWLPEHEVDASNLAAGTYHVEFSYAMSYANTWVHYDVTVGW